MAHVSRFCNKEIGPKNYCICILNVLRVTIHNQNLHKITEICKFCSLRHSIIDDIQSQFSITTLKSSITILKRLRFSITILKRFPVLSKILVTKFVVSLNNVQTTNETPLRFDISTLKTSQELRMLSSVTINCQVTMID